MSDTTHTEPIVDKASSPGGTLRSAREKYGLSEEDVAAELNLSVHQIKALEEDRFQELPGETYTRGYLKAYARLLNAEEDVVLSQFGQREVATITGIQPVIRETRSGDRHMKLLSLAVVAILSGLMFMWWQGRDDSNVVPLKASDSDVAQSSIPQAGNKAPDQPGVAEGEGDPEDNGSDGFVSESARKSDEIQIVSGNRFPFESAENSGSIFVSNPGSPIGSSADQDGTGELQNTTLSSVTEETPSDQLQEIVVDSMVESEAPAVETSIESTAGPAAQSNGSGVSTTESAATSPVQSASAGQNDNQQPVAAKTPSGQEVKLSFASASWVDLRDGSGQRLLYKNVNEGENLTVRGKPPFSVFLGNAQGVSIEYQGEPFDFTAFTNGIYARFELGPGQAN